MAQLSWSPRASRNLEESCDYIAQSSEQNARAFANEVREKVEQLIQHPRLGGRVSEYDRDDVRELLVQNYRIIYRLRGEDVEVVTIVRGARRLPRTPPG
jgi:toxin ParE1/3/4